MCHGHLDPKILMREAEARMADLPRATTETEKTPNAAQGLGPVLARLAALWTRKDASHV
ncbi:MAG: hypothetical protein AAGJ96_08005 [Pseudomonadota bacterium]